MGMESPFSELDNLQRGQNEGPPPRREPESRQGLVALSEWTNQHITNLVNAIAYRDRCIAKAVGEDVWKEARETVDKEIAEEQKAQGDPETEKRIESLESEVGEVRSAMNEMANMLGNISNMVNQIRQQGPVGNEQPPAPEPEDVPMSTDDVMSDEEIAAAAEKERRGGKQGGNRNKKGK